MPVPQGNNVRDAADGCSAADGWDVVQSSSDSNAVETFLKKHGLGNQAPKLIEVMGADTVDDLKLIDTNMIEEIVAAASLMVVSAKKFRLAIASLTGDGDKVEKMVPDDEMASAVAAQMPNQIQQQAPEEVVILCIDRSGSMRSAFLEAAAWADQGNHVEQLRRTRMEAVKQMFYAFRDRTESTRKHHLLGLTQFDNIVETMLAPTAHLDSFESIVDDMQPRGQTAIYSAIHHAAELLQPFKEITLRIVCLTDGQSNTGMEPAVALEQVRKVGAVVDAIIVGDSPDGNLRRIVAATGGECWQINNVTEGFELLEAESVVSLAARGGPRAVDNSALTEINVQELVKPSVAKRQRANITIGKVVDVQEAAKTKAKCDGTGPNSEKRILKELKQVAENNPAVWMQSGHGVHIFPSDDISVWRCLIEGPAGSPFEGGVFPLTVHIPSTYPFTPPKIRFDVPVYHCNISESGQPCLDILDCQWSPSMTVPKALESLQMLLATPDPNNALRQWVAELTLASKNTAGADARYVDEARTQTVTHASKSVDEWKATWSASSG